MVCGAPHKGKRPLGTRTGVKGREPFRVDALLGLLAALVSLMVFVPPREFDPAQASVGWVAITCLTDSHGNSYLLDRMLTTRYPLGSLLMEAAAQTQRRGALLRAR